ncbi:DedA family protein [Tropicimonas sp. IMCC6043]|uniref:DedA family protein n=1 Tax=Tropicimonas sp. IMCC6043 TaxID=2510645 RepID=UPI00101CE3A4|nr:VTT domain-containing protein [Tropicimonas sp. IMCC6043]RYH09898.1 DedA family protein [Tropicimonas sp. IMCC6043]
MIDTVLALVPVYGLYLIAAVVMLSCLAIPLPASVLVMASGGFAAAGDLVLWQVIGAAYLGFVIGDQTAFNLARWRGPGLFARLKARPSSAGLAARAETLVARWGAVAVLAGRTIVAPLGPWTSYAGGAAGLGWARFTAAAMLGAAVWAAGYALLGFFFADQISAIAELLVDISGFILSGVVALGAGWWLWRAWRLQGKVAQTGK